ncbi:hypothetical protein BGX26_012644, partial [Mortierella sp. AD094]
MKFAKSILLISAAIATIASATPLTPANVDATITSNLLSRRDDNPTLGAVVKVTT